MLSQNVNTSIFIYLTSQPYLTRLAMFLLSFPFLILVVSQLSLCDRDRTMHKIKLYPYLSSLIA